MSDLTSVPTLPIIVGNSTGFVEKDVTTGFRRIHPLVCTPILQNILCTLDFEELKTCRLVCGHWNTMSLLQMKNDPKVLISLIDEDRLNEFCNTETGYSNYQRFKCTFSMGSVPTLSQFMNQFKNQIKDVTFVVGRNEDVIYNLIDKLLLFLAKYSSAWESFGLEINDESSAEAPSTTLESYSVNWSQLKSLSIVKVREFPIFEEILEKASKLEKLVIKDGPLYETYYQLLRNLVDTMIELELVDYLENLRNAVHPAMLPFTKLKSLKVALGAQCLNLSGLPELNHLSLRNIREPRRHYIPPHHGVYSELSSLEWGYGCSIPENKFKEFPHIFPNLKKLWIQCKVNSEEVKMVWKHLRMIEELRLDCSNDVTDEAIIGFSCEGRHLDNINWSAIYKSVKNEVYMDTGIRNLSQLKGITINAPNISNFSILHGLLKFKSLRSVHITSPSPYLTKEILIWMADELDLMNLSIDVSPTTNDWGTSGEVIYFRTNRPHCQLTFPEGGLPCIPWWDVAPGTTNFSRWQMDALERIFCHDPRPRTKTMFRIGDDLKLSFAQVDTWFENRGRM